MKPSEYGGADTTATQGIQPPPNLVMEPFQELRLLYATDSLDETSAPDAAIEPTRVSSAGSR